MSAVKKLGLILLVLLIIAFLISCADPIAQQEGVDEDLTEEIEPLDEDAAVPEDDDTGKYQDRGEDKLPSFGSSFKHEVNIKTDGIVKEGQGEEWWVDEEDKSDGWWED